MQGSNMRHSLLNEEDIAKESYRHGCVRGICFKYVIICYLYNLIVLIVQCTSIHNTTHSNVCGCLMYACVWCEQDITLQLISVISEQ